MTMLLTPSRPQEDRSSWPKGIEGKRLKAEWHGVANDLTGEYPAFKATIQRKSIKA
jgi:hypothetical protein